MDFFPAFPRHSSVRTPTVHLNFSTWVFSCVRYLQGQNLWLCLSSVIHLSSEEQEDWDTKKNPNPKGREVHFSFNCLKKHLPPGPLWIYAKRERMQPLNSNWDKSLSPLIIPPLTHKSQSTRKIVHSSHKALLAPRREAQLKQETRETNDMGAISLMNRTLFPSYSS